MPPVKGDGLPDNSTGTILLLQAIDLPRGDRARGRAGEGVTDLASTP